MKIDRIYYRLKSDLRDGASEEITLVGIPGEDESVSQVVEYLRDLASGARLPNKWAVVEEIRKGKQALQDLNLLIHERTKAWNELAHFLRTQGVNPDIPNAPLELLKLPEAIQGEMVERGENEF